MKPDKWWVLGGLTVVLGLILVTALLVLRPDHLTERDHRRLQVGMTRVTVERVLGGPPRTVLRWRGAVWVPQADGTRVSAFVDAGAVDLHFFPRLSYDQDQAIWVTPTGLIAVAFGRDGRVNDTYFSTVHLPEGPSVWNWLASRPHQIRKSLGY